VFHVEHFVTGWCEQCHLRSAQCRCPPTARAIAIGLAVAALLALVGWAVWMETHAYTEPREPSGFAPVPIRHGHPPDWLSHPAPRKARA
jgi:hypothetical protein